MSYSKELYIILLYSWTERFYGDIQSPQADTEDGDKTPVEFPEVKKKVIIIII